MIKLFCPLFSRFCASDCVFWARDRFGHYCYAGALLKALFDAYETYEKEGE